MPSFLELLESAERAGPPPPLDLLATVKAEGGRRRRRRRRRNLAIGGVAVVLVALPVAALAFGGDDPQAVRVVDAPSSGEEDGQARSTATTVPTEVLGVVIERPGEADAEDTGSASARPATPDTGEEPGACTNSVDQACGAFRWEPDPGNAPLVLETASEVTLAPGQATTIVVDWSDADAQLRFEYFSADGTLIGSGCSSTPRYGPWTPPAPRPGSGSLAYAYTAPSSTGDRTVGVSLGSGECNGPFASEAHVLITVHVVEP